MYRIIILIFFIFLISGRNHANDRDDIIRESILNYIFTLKDFSSDFIQSGYDSIEEGSIYIKDKRVRIDYLLPRKIKIIISKDRVMYFDQEIQEVSYFNPKNSLAKIFYEFFFSKKFFEDSIYLEQNNFLIIEKNLITEEEDVKLKFFFEINPVVFRKIEIIKESEKTTFSILSPNHNPQLTKKFFTMANPTIK